MIRRQTYRDGWRYFRRTFLAHHAQGVVCGVGLGSGEWELALIAGVYILGYIGYQFGSAVRKYLNGGAFDSPGWDIVDVTAPAAIVGVATWMVLNHAA